jgi:hypothetical protein
MRDPTAWVATLVIAVLGSGPGARPVAKLPVSGSAGLPYPPANLSRTLDGPKTGLWLNGSESFVLFYGLDSFMVQGPSVAPTTSLHGALLSRPRARHMVCHAPWPPTAQMERGLI